MSFNIRTTIVAAAFAAGITQAANAATITQPFATDAGFTAFLAQPGVSELFVAEGRIGDRSGAGEKEVGLFQVPPGTGGAAIAGGNQQVNWPNGSEPVAFTLSRVGTTLSFALGDYDASYTADAVGDVNALVFRLRATAASMITLSDLALDAAPLTPDALMRGSEGAEYWLLSSVEGDFSLTGNVTMSWEGAAPLRSALAFQIKGVATPVAVPEPASLALLGLGLMGLAAARRRRG